MAEHDGFRVGTAERAFQQLIAAYRGAQYRSVVAQFTDLCRRLVHETQTGRDDADRAGWEQRVVATRLELVVKPRVVHVEVVSADQHVQAGRVAASHLEPVERRQRDDDREVAVDGRGRGGCEFRNRARGAETVVAHRPHRIAAPDQRGVERLERTTTSDPRTEIERRFDLPQPGFDGVEPVAELGCEDGRVEHGACAGRAAERSVDAGERGCTPVETLGGWRATVEHLVRMRDLPQQLGEVGGCAPSAAPHDADDAAHTETLEP